MTLVPKETFFVVVNVDADGLKKPMTTQTQDPQETVRQFINDGHNPIDINIYRAIRVSWTNLVVVNKE